MKKTLLLVLSIFLSISLEAITVKFDTNRKYRIECSLHNTGTFTIGMRHNKNPMIYYDASTTVAADGWWYVEGDNTKGYTFKNAVSGEYLQYTTDRINSSEVGSSVKGMNLSSTNTTNATKWKLDGSGSSFAVISMQDNSESFNLRLDGSNLVGTYTYSADRGVSANSLFTFYDESGTAVLDDSDTGGGEVIEDMSGITDKGEYWERTGLSVPIVYTTNVGNPVLYTIKNVRSGKFVNTRVDSWYWGSDPKYALTLDSKEAQQFYFTKTADGGVNIYTSDGYYVSGTLPSEENPYVMANVSVIKGTTKTTDNIWNFLYYQKSHSGYGLYVKTCTANASNNPLLLNGEIYWNDYSSQDTDNAIGYYSLDAGSTFVFYSSDERHCEYLLGNGIKFEGLSIKGTAISSYLKNIEFNGKPIVYDKYYDQYMLPVSKNYMNGKDYKAKVTFEQKFAGMKFKLHLGKDSLVSGDNFTLPQVNGNSPITMCVLNGKDTVATNNMYATFMPVVEITMPSCNSSFYTAGSIRVNNPENDGVDTLYSSKFKYRGATASGLPKKAFAVKLTDAVGNSIDRALLGTNYREDNNWILDAMGIDNARMRNRVSTDLWNDFAAKPYYFSKEKKAVPATRGLFVEVLLNGQYQGAYCLTEKLDRKQLKLKKYNPKVATATDTIRGVLYKTGAWCYETFMGHDQNSQPQSRTLTKYDNNIDTWCSQGAIEAKYPDLDDNESIDWGPLYNAINVCANTDSITFVGKVDSYFDRPVWLDYYLFLEMMLATDNHGKNMYLMNYNIQDAATKNKISLAPWDLDGTWGIRWDGSTRYTSDATQDFDTFIWKFEHGQHNYFQKMKSISYLGFKDALAYRYAQLRKGQFLVGNLVKRFADYADLYSQSGTILREKQRWSASGYLHVIDSSCDLPYIQEWIKSRVETLDKTYGYDSNLDPSISTRILNVKSDNFSAVGGNGQIFIKTMTAQTIKVFTISGACVKTQYVPIGENIIGGFAAGAYLVNGQKVLVQ